MTNETPLRAPKTYLVPIKWCRSHGAQARWQVNGQHFCCVEYVNGPCDVVDAMATVPA